MILYHGSDVIVNKPIIYKGNRPLDFGNGFYLTSSKDQAGRWAKLVAYKRGAQTAIINSYEFDIKEAEKLLSVMHFHSADEKWLKYICANRSGKSLNCDYDIIIGPVADDRVYSVIVRFENGDYELEEALKRLKTEKLCDQILLHTDKALDYLKFLNWEKVDE